MSCHLSFGESQTFALKLLVLILLTRRSLITSALYVKLVRLYSEIKPQNAFRDGYSRDQLRFPLYILSINPRALRILGTP